MQSPNPYAELERSIISTKSWRTTSYIIQQLKRLPAKDTGYQVSLFFFPTLSGQHSTISWERYSGEPLLWGRIAIPMYNPKVAFSQLTPLCLAFSFQDRSSQNCWPTNAFKEAVLLQYPDLFFPWSYAYSLLITWVPFSPQEVSSLWGKGLSRF